MNSSVTACDKRLAKQLEAEHRRPKVPSFPSWTRVARPALPRGESCRDLSEIENAEPVSRRVTHARRRDPSHATESHVVGVLRQRRLVAWHFLHDLADLAGKAERDRTRLAKGRRVPVHLRKDQHLTKKFKP